MCNLLSRSPAPMEFRIEEITELFDCKKGYGKGKYVKSLGKYDKSNEYIKNNDYGKGNEKGKERGKTGKGKAQGKDEKPAPVSNATAGHVASGGTRRVSVGKVTCKPWRKFRVLPRVQWRRVQRPHLRLRRQQRLFKNSMMRRNQDGSSA